MTNNAGTWGTVVASSLSSTTGQISSGTYVHATTVFRSTPQTINCDADCDSPVTINSSIVIVNCTNAGGCVLGLAETNWSATVVGEVTIIAGPTQTGALTMPDQAGVLETAGGATWTPNSAGDSIKITYSPALYWIQSAPAVDVTL